MYLNCHTGFSFQHGTLSIKELVAEARRCGVAKLAITEINNTASYMELLRLCDEIRPRENGRSKFGDEPYLLDLAVGIEFRNAQHELLYIGLAKNNEGFEQLNRLLSHYKREARNLPPRAPELRDAFFIYPFGKADPDLLRANEYIGVAPQNLSNFTVYAPRHTHADRFVALLSVTFLPPRKTIDAKTGRSKEVHRDFNTHRLLRSIANNTLLSKLAAEQQADPGEFMRPKKEYAHLFASHPALLTNAEQLLNQCSIDIRLRENKNKRFFTNSAAEDLALLRRETEKGYALRYGDDTNTWQTHIEKELRIIEKKNFTNYYLITYDLISFAKEKGYDYVGRGSGANSTVAYCLGITNVDPIELDLYFERFLNEERLSPPDFDIDFAWDNRDAIYEYLFSKYGPDHICLLGTHVTYQSKSIIRELAKVFGLPKDEIDGLVETRRENVDRDSIGQLIFNYAAYIMEKELPSNFSIHAGGVLITEKPIYAYTATDLPPKGLPVTHFEMNAAEDFGIHKFDILSQRGLGHIKETVKHIRNNRGEDVDVYQFKKFKSDEKIKELMRSGRTMGCFYVESPATRMLLGKLRCSDYLTLVAASSIIRPGVASSGMMQAYIKRFHAMQNGGTYEGVHPLIDELMRETYGVMVYQEDVIKVAHHFAGLSLTEADVLRRGMSGKYRSRAEFQRVKDLFFDGCRARGYPSHVIDRVWFEIESFAGYSFAKGHSASYAVESYQSLFLKAHYPLEFMVGVINNFGGFYKTEFYVHEARMSGATIEAPCINNSAQLTSIKDTCIYVGFAHVKSLETKVVEKIISERTAHGTYRSLEDFLTRVPGIGLEQVRILIRLNAFRFYTTNKQQLLWECMLWFSHQRTKVNHSGALFDTGIRNLSLPDLERSTMEDAFDQMELLGFPLCNPFELVQSDNFGNVTARELPQAVKQPVEILGYVVTTKDSSTKAGALMQFGTFYDCEGRVFDTVHFPEVCRKHPFRGRGFYLVKGKVIDEFGVVSIEVSSMEKVPFKTKRPLEPLPL